MKLTGYRGYNWENDGYHAGVPNGAVFSGSVVPNVIYRANATPVFGPGRISEMSVAVEFLYSGSETYETAWAQLLAKLDTLNAEPATLFGQLNDGTSVRTEAVVTVPNQYDTDINTLTVVFVSVSGKFESAGDPSTATGTFTTTPATALRAETSGNKPTNATVRLKPTTSATSGWTYRRRYRLTNGTTRTISSYPWCLNLGDTSSLVSTKALSSGNDVRLLIGGLEVQRNLVDWNVSGTDTLCWFIIPSIAPSGTLDVEVIYGNSGAGAPPTLAYPNLPAFDITTTGANRSTNAQWVYKVEEVAANAAKGAWYIDTGSASPNVVDTGIPGAWRPDRTFAISNSDDFLQPSYSDYTDTLTYYMGRFEATRAKYGSIANQETGQSDGVVLNNVLGISSVVASMAWLNEGETSTSTTPVGKLVILGRNGTGQNWTEIYSNTTLYTTSTAIASATYTPAAAVQQLAFAVWPYNTVGVPASATSGQEAIGTWGSTLKVNIASTNLTQSTVQAETAVYEVRAKLRLERSGSNGTIGEQVKLGNYDAATGATTPHLLVELNQQVEVDGAYRTVKVKNSGNTATVETPPSAVSAITAETIDNDGNSTTGPSTNVLQLVPENTSYITNPSFATVATSWTRGTVTSGITAAAIARDTSVYDSSPAAGKTVVSASTAASGSVIEDIASDYITLGSIRRISIGAAVRTTTADLRPRLTIWWYDGSNTLVGSSNVQADWTPTANTWYRRVHSATKPAGAIKARVGMTTYSAAANATGSVWIDTIAILGNDIQIDELSGGSITAVATWVEQYA